MRGRGWGSWLKNFVLLLMTDDKPREFATAEDVTSGIAGDRHRPHGGKWLSLPGIAIEPHVLASKARLYVVRARSPDRDFAVVAVRKTPRVDD